MQAFDRQQAIVFLEQTLEPKRFAHSLGVEEMAVQLAEKYGADPQKAAIAGLLHDCAKRLPPEEMIRRAVEFGIQTDPISLSSPSLLHGAAGAWTARQELAVTDEQILSAICWHTIPSGNMSILDKIVYVADLAEKNRDYPGVEELRGVLQNDLQQGYLQALGIVISNLIRRKKAIHLNSILEYNDLVFEMQSNNNC